MCVCMLRDDGDNRVDHAESLAKGTHGGTACQSMPGSYVAELRTRPSDKLHIYMASLACVRVLEVREC